MESRGVVCWYSRGVLLVDYVVLWLGGSHLVVSLGGHVMLLLCDHALLLGGSHVWLLGGHVLWLNGMWF